MINFFPSAEGSFPFNSLSFILLTSWTGLAFSLAPPAFLLVAGKTQATKTTLSVLCGCVFFGGNLLVFLRLCGSYCCHFLPAVCKAQEHRSTPTAAPPAATVSDFRVLWHELFSYKLLKNLYLYMYEGYMVLKVWSLKCSYHKSSVLWHEKLHHGFTWGFRYCQHWFAWWF